MTPSMGMAAPKGAQAPAAPQAGLAALAQPAQAPKGKAPENMGAMMALARKMSDMQLADVLTGKSLDVPQYVAMTEAMGRKQLRNAMQGAQAMAQAKQPSLKDRLMAEQQAPVGLPQMAPQQPVMAAEGGLMYGGGGAIDMNETANSGLAMLPAMNMMPMTMADGGIVAFDEGGEVPRYYSGGTLTPDEIEQMLTRGSIRRSPEEIEKAQKEQSLFGMSPRTRAAIKDKTSDETDAGAPHPSSVPAPTAAQTAAFMGDVPPAPTIAAAPKVETKKSGLESLLGGKPTSFDQAKKDHQEDYLAALANLSTKQREGIAQLRKESGGEALMQLAAGILGRPTLQQGLAAGLPLVASTAAASRKEQREIEKTANDYDLNLARYRAALQEGDKDRAVKYLQLANEDKYHMAMVNKPGAGLEMLNALGDPEMMRRYKQMYSVQKGADAYPIASATDDFNKIMSNPLDPQFKILKAKNITNPFAYQQYVLNSTMDGGGTGSLSQQAAAVLAERERNKQKT